MQINSAKDLNVYKAAYELAMRVFALSKRGREICVNESNPPVVALYMFEPA